MGQWWENKRQQDIGIVALCYGWHPASLTLLSLSLSAVHMSRECDRTNVPTSKEYILTLTDAERWTGVCCYAAYRGTTQDVYPESLLGLV